MREKPANEQAVSRLIDFLRMVRFQSQGTPNTINFPSLIQNERVAKTVVSDCKVLKIFSVEKDKVTTTWLKNENYEDFRKLALEILDYRLKKTKKKIHVPIPDFAAFGETLRTISERLAHIALQQEQWLKRVKIGHSEDVANIADVNQQNLFEQQQQRQKDRVYIAGQIASKVYYNLSLNTSDFVLNDKVNAAIVQATDDLLEKLYS